MARTPPKKPRSLKLDTTSARAIRGPQKDGSGRWYWRADMYVGEGRRTTLWTGWATREEARQEISKLLAQAKPAEAAQEARDARASEVQTVRDLLEVYMGAEQTRVSIWRREEQTGEDAVARGAAKTALHSKDALAPRTYKAKHYNCKHLLASLGPIRVTRLSTADLRSYVAHRLGDAAPGTVRNEIATLKAAWTWGARDSRDFTLGIGVSWPNVLGTTIREKFTPTRFQFEKALDQLAPGWTRDILTVQSVLGCRIGALARLPRRDVDLERGTVRLKCKAHDRTIRVPSEVLDILRSYIANAEEHGTVWGKSESTILKIAQPLNNGHPSPWARACEAAGVQRVTTHGVRRMVSNEWIAAGVNVAVYARILGHSPEEALRAYAAIQGDDEIAAFNIASKVQARNVVPLASRRPS